MTNARINWMLGGNSPEKYETESPHVAAKAADRPEYYLASKSASQQEFGVLSSDTDPQPYLGKRLRLKAKIKSENTHSGASLWMRADTPNKDDTAFDNMWNRQVIGSYDWTEYGIVLQIPKDATHLWYGAMLRGQGECWVSDFRFEVVGDDVPLTQMKFIPRPKNL